LVESDILDVDWAALLDGTEYVFHQAAQAGVRGSWGDGFDTYVRNNIQATQRLLESARQAPALKGLIFASSSSVYGDAESLPTLEDAVPLPISPYGVTKLTCEQLCRVYYRNFGVPTIILRYFVAYGPRQRPDMAFHRFIQAILQGKEISVYGDGEQTRDFTYVSDTIQANLLAMNPKAVGQIFNVGGGSRITVNQVIRLLEHIVGKPAQVRYLPSQKGDARHTFADISRARAVLQYVPKVPIEEGLAQEVEWLAHCLQTPSQPLQSTPPPRERK
jgi:nucleoside-diphosphate-sugar epimerase